MDREKTITLKGITRNRYVFTIVPWGAPTGSTSAVYAVLRRNHIGYAILYIGTTCNLGADLYQHPQLDEFESRGMTHVGVHIEPVVSRRQTKQTDLLASYAPELNCNQNRQCL